MGIYETLKYTSSTTGHADAGKGAKAGTTNVPQDVKDIWEQVKAEEAKRKEEEKKRQGGK